jgi:hypothetical protein
VTGPIGRQHLESELESFFRRRVKALGGHTEKIVSMNKGLPDRLVLMPGGRMYLVELKAEKGRVDPAQRVWHSRAAALGVKVPVLVGRAGVLNWLRSITTEEERRAAIRKRNQPGRVELS